MKEWSRSGKVKNGDIVLALGNDVRVFPEATTRLLSISSEKEWELVVPVGGGLVIAGSMPRNVCKAALSWIADPAGETDRLSTYKFTERFTMWDNSMNQECRFSKGFDRRSQMREIARLGHTGVEINRYADPGGYHVRHRKFVHDSYAWYCSYAPALDAFVESSLTKGIYLPEELANNLADLRKAAAMARDYGLKPGFVCYEPRCVSEKIFDRYPELRGSRTDHPGRSLQPRYSLDIAHPRVLEHYAEMTTNLMQQVPDLRYFVFWVQDSGSGIPFARNLYFGPNGSFLARSKTVEGMVANFSQTILKAGRKVNPGFEVIMEIGGEYTDEEFKSIVVNVPKGVTLAHPVGGTLLHSSRNSGTETYLQEDTAAGVDPYLSIVVAAGFDAEPIIGAPSPGLLIEKFSEISKMSPRRLFTNGGLFSSPQCLYNINQELYGELIREGAPDPDRFLLATAERWCDGDHVSASLLIEAWKTGDEAVRAWPRLNWYTSGIGGPTQGRWITRPLVPDITRLTERERAAWERELFPLPSDLARLNIVFEAGIRYFEDEELVGAVHAFDQGMLPRLEKVVEILNRALAVGGKPAIPVLEDQRDRYRGILLLFRTERNVYEAQIAINNCLLKKGDPVTERKRLDTAVQAEMINTREWIHALTTSKTDWFHLAAQEETPFLYKTPVEDLKIKLEAMQAHREDEPGPYLAQLIGPKPTLLFSAVH